MRRIHLSQLGLHYQLRFARTQDNESNEWGHQTKTICGINHPLLI